MKILETPIQFQSRRLPSSPTHDLNYSVAEAFLDAVIKGLNPQTDRIYIPILWSNSYHNYRESRKDPVFRAVPDIQKFLDYSLDPDKQYFTVTRCDEGIYEELPPNVQVFGAGDNADIQLPLSSKLSSLPPGEPKHLASFVGAKRSGGPRPCAGLPTFSDYDPDGVGTRIRTKMFKAFEGNITCRVVDRCGGNENRFRDFQQTANHSKYALAPRGYTPTSFRLYEAMALGSVPVYISDKFLLPYAERLEWMEFCVICGEAQIPDLPARLANIPEEWRLTAVDRLAAIYPLYFSLNGVVRQITQYLETEDD